MHIFDPIGLFQLLLPFTECYAFEPRAGVSTRRHPLVESVARSESYARGVSRLSVLRSRFAVSFHTGLAGFRHRHRRLVVYSIRIEPLSEFNSPPEFSTSGTSSRCYAKNTSRELLRPTAPANRRVHYARALPARGFRLQGLATLLAVFSSAALPTLFQVGSALGLRPSEHSPRIGRHDIPAALTHLPLAGSTSCARRTQAMQSRHRLLGFVPDASPLQSSRTVRPDSCRRLPWDSPFQGNVTARLATAFAATPSSCLAARPTVATRVACTLKYHSPCGSRTRRTGLATLVGFSHRSVPRRSERRQPGLCVRLTGRFALLSRGPDPWVLSRSYRSHPDRTWVSAALVHPPAHRAR
jgi:hypothetical protein